MKKTTIDEEREFSILNTKTNERIQQRYSEDVHYALAVERQRRADEVRKHQADMRDLVGIVGVIIVVLACIVCLACLPRIYTLIPLSIGIAWSALIWR